MKRSFPLLAALFLLSFPSLEGTLDELDKHLGKEWYGIYFSGVKCGFMSSSLEKGNWGGKSVYKFTCQFTANLKMGGMSQEIKVSEKRIYSVRDEKLLYVSSDMEGMTGTISAVGRREKNELILTTTIAGESKEKTMELPPETLSDFLTAERMVMSKGAKLGDKVSFVMFEPTPPIQRNLGYECTLKERKTQIFNGVKTDVLVVETQVPELGLVETSIHDEHGHILEAKVSEFFIMRLEPEELAKKIEYSYDVIISQLIPVDKPITDAKNRKEIKLRLRGIHDPSLILESDRQSYQKEEEGVYLLTLKGDELPQSLVTIQREKFKEELSPSPLIQSDNKGIIELAKQIAGQEKDLYKKALKINSWVYDNIEKEFTASFSNALEVLESKRGDCSEHSVIFVALCRAAGIPARQVVGVAYWEEVRAFGYHLWAEVYAGRWIAMDPAWGEAPADVTHIKFAQGDLFSQARILKLIGKLKIEVDTIKIGTAPIFDLDK